MNKKHRLLISKAPSDPVEHEKWAKKMMRIQLAMYVDDKATCEQCGYTYKNVDDFMRCNPRNGKTKKITFVCGGCWKEYEKSHERD